MSVTSLRVISFPLLLLFSLLVVVPGALGAHVVSSVVVAVTAVYCSIVII